MENKKIINVWFAINKNGSISMFLNKPTKNTKTGKWESNHFFVNSLIYSQIKKLVEQTKMNWESEPEVIQFI
jgi:hypothetical protein